MALTLRLPTTAADRDLPRSLVIAVEVVGVVAMIGALAMLSSETMLIILLGVAFVAVAAFALVLSRPTVLVEMAIITMWFDSVGFGPVRTGRLIAGLTIMVLFARMATSNWRPPSLQLRAWGWPAAFFTWAFLSGLWSLQIGSWMTGISELILGFVYAVIILAFLENEPQFAKSFRAWIWTGVPIAAICYWLYNRNEKLQDEIGGENRIVGFTGNANAYAALLTLAVPIAVLFARRAETKRARNAYILAGLGFMVALVTTGSRAGMMALVLMLMYIAVTLPGLTINQRVRSAIFGAIFVAVGLVAAAMWNPERYSIAGFFGDAGAGRLDLWNAATSSISERPIFGESIGGFRTRTLDTLTKTAGASLEITRPLSNRQAGAIEAHNTYLTIILDLGFIGLALYVGMIVSVFRNLWDIRKTQWRDWSWVLMGGQLALLLTSFFGSEYNIKFQWMIVGLSGAPFVYARHTGRIDRVRGHSGLTPLRRKVRPLAHNPQRPFLGERTFAAPMDLRIRYPFRLVMVAAMLTGAVFSGMVAKAFGTPTYTSYARVVVYDFDGSKEGQALGVSDDRIQFVLNLARSVPFYAEVKRLSGVDLSVEKLSKVIEPNRPNFAAMVRITIVTKDEEVTRRIGASLVPALDVAMENARSGALMMLDGENRQVNTDIASEYSGPLYLTPYLDPVESSSTPRVALCALIGGVFGALVVTFGAMLAHRQRRLTSEEDIEEQLGVPFVAAVPRPRFARQRRVDERYRAAADLVEAACPTEPRVVGVASVDLGGLQSRVAAYTSLGLGTVVDRPVVIVDLDAGSGSLSRQLGARRGAGLLDVATGTARLEQVIRPIRQRRFPRTFARLRSAVAQPVSFVPVGGHRRSDDDPSLLAPVIAELIDELAQTHLVVVNLPLVPGPISVGQVLELCDAVLLCVLDGWTDAEDAMASVDTLTAAVDNRVGYVLIDQ